MTFTKKFRDTKRSDVKCKYCKKGGVHWSHTQWGWLLFNKKTGKRHNCRK